MGNLSQFLPDKTELVNLIYKWHKEKGDAEPQRGYLGGSILGYECERRLWYTFRGLAVEDVPGRIYRLFETGDVEEGRFVAELRGIGCEVWDTDEDGEQFEVLALGGHASGHLDAIIQGIPEAPETPHLGEFKTHKDSSFKALLKDGVQKSKPLHYAQMQFYMGLMDLKRAVYLAKNKDTDELFAVRIKFDKRYFDRLMEKAERVITASMPPERAYDRMDHWECKFCPAYRLCWGVNKDGLEEDGQPAVPIPAKTCKSCCHSTPETDREGAVWTCAKFDCEVGPEVGVDCPAHLLLPALVTFATAEDADDDWIEFKNTSGEAVWRHGSGDGCWTTDELIAGPGPLEGAKLPAELQEDDELPLLGRYPWDDSELVWDGPDDDLEAMLEFLEMSPVKLNKIGPRETQVDDEVNAAEYKLGGGSFLIVVYKKESTAAIWKGKA